MNKKNYFGLNQSEWSWALYDWANSAYATTVMAGLFPIFFKKFYASTIDFSASTYYLGLTLSIAGGASALVNPFLGYLSDVHHLKKQLVVMFSLIAIVFVIGFAFLSEGQWLLALVFYGISQIGFQMATSLYDSLLPDVTVVKKYHQVSSFGYSLGYFGGGLLFLINVLMLTWPESFGIDGKVSATQLSFVSVGLWWLLFMIPMMINVKQKKREIKNGEIGEINLNNIKFSEAMTESAEAMRAKERRVGASGGMRYKSALSSFMSYSLDLTSHVFELFKIKYVRYFLIAYWLYIDVVYTVINMATDYGVSVGLNTESLIGALLLVQFLGFPFTLVTGKLAHYFSVKKIIYFLIGMYFVIIIFATQIKQAYHFWILAVLISMAQGGIQALSRSFFSEIIDQDKSGQYFGVFNLVGRFASIIGPLLVGAATLALDNHRTALLSLLAPLLLGSYFLSKAKNKKSELTLSH